MLVTLLGMVIVVKPVQPENAELPILVTPLGMVIEVKPVQLENAEPEIETVPSFTSILVPAGIVPLYLYNTLLI